MEYLVITAICTNDNTHIAKVSLYDGNSHDAVKLNIENDSINVEYSVDDGHSWSSECHKISNCGK